MARGLAIEGEPWWRGGASCVALDVVNARRRSLRYRPSSPPSLSLHQMTPSVHKPTFLLQKHTLWLWESTQNPFGDPVLWGGVFHGLARA